MAVGRLRLAQSKHHPEKTSTWADAGATLPDGQLRGKTAVKQDQEARRWRATATMEHAPNPFSILHNFRRGATSETGFPRSVPERARGGQDHSGFPPRRRAWETWGIFTCLQKDKAGAAF